MFIKFRFVRNWKSAVFDKLIACLQSAEEHCFFFFVVLLPCQCNLLHTSSHIKSPP